MTWARTTDRLPPEPALLPLDQARMLWFLNMAHDNKLTFSFFIVFYAYEIKNKGNIAIYLSNLEYLTVVLHFFPILLCVL